MPWPQYPQRWTLLEGGSVPVQYFHMEEPPESPAQSLLWGGCLEIICAGAMGAWSGEAGVAATGLGEG